MAKRPNSPDFPDEPLDPLVEEAISRLLHLHSGEETEQDWSDFQNWKEASDANRAAAEHAELIWHRIGPASSRKTSPKKIPIILVASLGLAGLGFALGWFGEPRAFFADYRTGIGEQRTVTLRDGSRIDIDSGTSFDVGPDSRSITLYSGQISLSVRSTPENPFVVRAGGGTVSTLGTKFNVREDGDEITTFVTENAVRVNYGQGQQSVDVHAGQVTSYSPRNGLQAAHAADIHALTAWQRGELIFKDRPLGEVIARLERYRRGRIIIIGDDVRRLPVTGVFDIHDPDSALASLALALPISFQAMPGVAVIYSNSNRTASSSEK
jgi:transmembrane sensor